MGELPVELVVAFEQLGRHAVPGPYAETVAAASLCAGLAGTGKDLLERLLAGDALATLGAPDEGPYVVDADAADALLVVEAPGEGP
ncbi:acyl-CoA dehydrogenase, partial [Streptomyces sp. SID14478]|nr:acyl-CoA dehydrogenase [Streptomyces sp. SID14478]